MKKLMIAGMFAAGMLATPLLATGAGASPNIQANPNASCVSAAATTPVPGGTPSMGVGLGPNGPFWFAPTPYGQLVQYAAQIGMASCPW